MDSPVERRAHPRYELLAQVRVKRGKVDYLMELSNISRGGAAFSLGSMDAPTWIEVGRAIEVAIIHPVDLDAVEVKGEIMRIQKTERDTSLGVRFVDVGAEQQQAIDRLVQLACASHPPPASLDASQTPASASPAPPYAQPAVGKRPPPLPR